VTRALAALVVVALALPARALPPDIVRWQDAGAHVGRVITVEGTVERAHVADGACTLEFAPGDPTALRVILMLPLFSSPADPERRYGGRRVQASGRVQRFEARPEIIIRRADQITVLDAPSPTTTTTTTTTTTVPAPETPVPTAPPPAPAPSSTTRTSEACNRARDLYHAARRELTLRSEDAARCLRDPTRRCDDERAAAHAALEALASREAESDAACR
jgi:hypothetical protein